MSATTLPSQSNSVAGSPAASGVSSAEVDVSCRVPVLLLFLSAAGWLAASSVLGLIASIKFHQPNFLADCPLLTYGRVHPAATNALVYGFCVQAGLGVLLWLVCQLGKARLALPVAAVGGWLLWNLGATAGVIGIFFGGSTGYEWLEMPGYAAALMFFGYLAIGVAGMLSFHHRSERGLHLTQWFLLAALFWFPWIYSTADLLLVVNPVRGTLQSIINWWYFNNLTNIWFGFVGLGTAFYFVPKIVNSPIYSHNLGVFTFWTLVIFGSWVGIPAATPLPAWIPALSTFAALLTIVPIASVALNFQRTLCGQSAQSGNRASLLFITFGLLAYVVSGLMAAISSVGSVSKITNFTWFIPAQTQLVLYGFFAMTMFGAIYYIVPRLLQMEFPSAKLIRFHFGLGAVGIALYVLPLAIGGIAQGFAQNDGMKPFLDVVKSTLPFLRASTTGDLFMAAGNVLLLLNLLGLLNRLGRASVAALMVHTKTAEAA